MPGDCLVPCRTKLPVRCVSFATAFKKNAARHKDNLQQPMQNRNVTNERALTRRFSVGQVQNAMLKPLGTRFESMAAAKGKINSRHLTLIALT
jgi:hypothetical protein